MVVERWRDFEEESCLDCGEDAWGQSETWRAIIIVKSFSNSSFTTIIWVLLEFDVALYCVYIVWYPLFIVNAIYLQYDVIHAHLGSYHNFRPTSHICKVVIVVVERKIPVAFLVQFQRTSHILCCSFFSHC